MTPRLVPVLLVLLLSGCYTLPGGGRGGRGGDDDDSAPAGADDDDATDDDDAGPGGLDQDGDGWAPDQGDCDDTDATRHPGAPEDGGTGTGEWNGVDDDCDGDVDEGTNAWDDDEDGWNEIAGDCDDADPRVNPDAVEIANGIDDDCDGLTDEDTGVSDDDGDGFSEAQGDCDDDDDLVYPDAPEDDGTGSGNGDGLDNDCDGLVDEGTLDGDDDGDLFSENDGDCDDADPALNPGAPEDGGAGTNNGDGLDNNCNGVVDEGTNDFDDDSDGYTDNQGDCDDFNPSVNPGLPELLGDGLDNDCDGLVDVLPQCDCPSTGSLTLAMDLCSGLVSSSITGPSSAVRSSFGLYAPRFGCRMLALSSGVIGGSVQPGTDFGAYGPGGDTTTLTLTLAVPTWATSFSFDLNFMSAEYPEWVGTAFNDFFFANLTSGAYNGNISFDANGTPIEINNAFFSVTSSSALAGTGFDGGVGGGTGWLTTTSPVVPGETITLQLTIGDIADGIYDSTVLLDNFQWGQDTLSVPETQQ